MPLIVGVKFNNNGKIYFFSPKKYEFKVGDGVIVETVRGIEYATIAQKNTIVSDEEIKAPLKEIIRKADNRDFKQYQDNLKKAENALKVCEEKILKHNLGMKLINAEYTFDKSKIIFNYTADGRVDFRELVKDLASELRIRIELHQVYEKDDVRLRGAMGPCGMECCCIKNPSVCEKATVKMAKNQNISLNPTKVSGMCGKLMCCLKYENEFYADMLKQMPKVNSQVKTEDGMVKVISVDILRESITGLVEIDDNIVEKKYKIGEFTLLRDQNQKQDQESESEEEIALKKLEQ